MCRVGAEALAKIRRNRCALVALDWNMPPWNGGEVLRARRAEGLRIPLVVVSGQPREAITLNLEIRAAAFVHKDELDPITSGTRWRRPCRGRRGAVRCNHVGLDSGLAASLENGNVVPAQGEDSQRDQEQRGRRSEYDPGDDQ